MKLHLRCLLDNSRYDPHKSDAVFVRASYREFLETPKNMNSLDNPLSGGVPAPVQLATDLRAAVALYATFPSDLPLRVMSWGLLAKADAVHPPHIDRPGTCTFIGMEAGLKKWDLAFPPNNGAEEEEIASPAAFGRVMTDGRNYTRNWQWYSILLCPGDTLYVFSFHFSFSYLLNPLRFMRPGTVHSVTTIHDSIAVGGHFFSAPTIKYSVYSIFHTFVGSHTITNVPMDSEQQMLLRIILFWHKAMCGADRRYLDRIANLDQGMSLFTFLFLSAVK